MRERLITIDINKVNFKILKYKQFDNNNILKVEITEKEKLIDLSGYSAYFFFKLPSGEILQKNTTIEDNKIKVFLDSGVFSESGRVKVEITLSNAEQIVTTFTMNFEIEETIDRNEAIQSKPEWDIISDILNGTGGTGGSIDISNKVDKEEGKGLISLSEIERLANVDNYDDTEIRELIKEKADKEDLHEHENKDILDEITEEKIEQWNKGGFSGDYNDLINKPTIPSIEGLATESYVKNEIANAQLDGGDVDLSGYATKDDLHEHTNKNILDNITSEKVNDWDNKSEFDGDYNSLTNKPTIPSLVGYATESYVKNEIANAQLNSDDNEVDLSGFATKDELNAKADVEDIPTKVSQLENDSNYLTSIPSEYITETELNDKGYLTEHQDISGKVDKEDGKGLISLSEIERLKNVDNYTHPSTHNATMITEDKNHRFVTDEEKALWNNKEEKNHTHKELHEHANKDILNDITSDKIDEWDNKSEFNGDYNSLTNKPTIPSIEGLATETYVQNKIAEAQLSGEEVDLSGLATKDELNAKADVEDIPTKVSQLENDSNYLTSIPSEYITETELNAKGYLTEHQNISGKADKSYVDTELATKSDTSHTHDQYLTEHQDISGKANKSEIPTKTSQLTNDSNFVSRNDIPTKTSQLQNDTDFATNASVDEKIANINTPSLESNTLTFGNYTITYNETDDTLDFIYNGVIEEPVVSNYVTEGLSMYIDASDVTTYGSIRDITGKQSITNNGVSTTLDNNCLNFVRSESDYIDCGFKPNLTQWSAELYFYFTAPSTSPETVLGWGSSGNRTAIACWDGNFIIAINSDTTYNITSTPPTSLTHVILTYNNGTIIAYVNGVKSQLTTSAEKMTSQAGNLMLGTKYNYTSEFTNIHLKSLRFYDGKVLTDEEALQNYNYETNRNVLE